MNPITLNPKDKKTVIESEFIHLKNEFDTLLSFVSESCSILYAFVTEVNEDVHTINTGVGLNLISHPSDIVCYQEFVEKKRSIYCFRDKKRS